MEPGCCLRHSPKAGTADPSDPRFSLSLARCDRGGDFGRYVHRCGRTRCIGDAGAIGRGGRILFAGHGGSAAHAQHFAAELVGRFNRDRPALPAIALGTDAATVTAIANDYGYDRVFERQLIAAAGSETVFVAISTSGKSPSILNAVEAARRLGLPVIGMTGQPGEPLIGRCHGAIIAPATETPLVQQLHLVAAHAICSIVEEHICCLKKKKWRFPWENGAPRPRR